MTSSTFSIQPSLLHKKHSRDTQWPPIDHGASSEQPPSLTASFVTTSFAANNLSPYSYVASSSASPINNTSTPAESLSAFSEQYASSDFSEQADPFFGANFGDTEGGTPSFLEDNTTSLEDSSEHSDPYPQTVSSAPEQNAHNLLTYPMSPDLISNIHTSSSRAEHKTCAALDHAPTESLSHVPSNPPRSIPVNFASDQLTPESRTATSTIVSVEEGPDSITAFMPSPSPRVLVSMYGRDQDHAEEPFPEYDESPVTVRAGFSVDDALISTPYQRVSTDRDDFGSWTTSDAGRNGWRPESRPTKEGASINELKVSRKIAQRNQEVNRWMTTYESGGSPDEPPASTDPFSIEDDGIRQRDIPLGSMTENRPLPGQTYYTERSGELTEDDLKLMRQHRAWADAPEVYRINNRERTQPETAQAAIQRFDQMCHETGSVLSRAATWGTRRRSLPSIADMDGVTSGNFLRKLTISRERKPSIILEGLRGLMRKPSANQLLKRHRTVAEDEQVEENQAQGRRESRDTLAPPGRTTSWAKKPQVPSLNTALVSMAAGAAAIGTTHARTSSISNVTSPKSPFFKNVRRARSRSELPNASSEESNLARMWNKSGGPPVAYLARGESAPELDDDEDEEDELYEGGDARPEGRNVMDALEPNLAGFKQQVLQMNPTLPQQNTYLIDRIAYQQVMRYKDLLKKRVKHIQQTNAGNCPSRHMCMALGGSAITFDAKGQSRDIDPLATNYDGASDGDGMPLEGAITAESFPPDIPIPPTTSMPAEFECQLCYSTKKFTKPSDWTKHVHEDVQPFTCTWDRCREPKIFKRKADWVRHENEGHRHLEWWTCDVEECRHICYRRDNFLQHLVREHKFPEPKVKTKAAVKKAGGLDPTWQRVEKCHADTHLRPQDEPCRFCGKVLPTWKKLTVHLAKHMENLSLPLLRLVALKDLDADTIISPVQEPPTRTFPPVKSESQPYSVSPNLEQPIHQGGLAFPVSSQPSPRSSSQPSYTNYATNAFPNFYDTAIPVRQQPSTMDLGLHQAEISSRFPSQTGYPVTSGAYLGSNQYNTMAQQLEPFPAYSNPLGLQTASGNQMYDTTALNPSNYGGDQQQYSQQGSASPYSHSPHQGQGGFYQQQR